MKRRSRALWTSEHSEDGRVWSRAWGRDPGETGPCEGTRRRYLRGLGIGVDAGRMGVAGDLGSCAEDEARAASRGNARGRRKTVGGRGRNHKDTVRREPKRGRTGARGRQATGASAIRDGTGWGSRDKIGGEFDPGSGSTLAACLMHASRTGRPSGRSRGGRVRNTWAICPEAGASLRKRRVIPYGLRLRVGSVRKGATRLGRSLRPISWTVGSRPTVAMIGSWSERTISHTGTETRPRLLREAAARNFPQWAQA